MCVDEWFQRDGLGHKGVKLAARRIARPLEACGLLASSLTCVVWGYWAVKRLPPIQ